MTFNIICGLQTQQPIKCIFELPFMIGDIFLKYTISLILFIQILVYYLLEVYICRKIYYNFNIFPPKKKKHIKKKKRMDFFFIEKIMILNSKH